MASREVWRKRIARWKESGQSKEEFASRLRVSPKSITYWDWRLRTEAAELTSKVAPMGPEVGAAATEPEPVPVPWPPPASAPALPVPPSAPAGESGSKTPRPRRGRPPKAKTAAPKAKTAAPRKTQPLSPVRWLQVVGGIDDEAEVAGPGSTMLELVLAGGRAIRVPRGFDAETLARLISVVEAR
jgi:hypothetical protein